MMLVLFVSVHHSMHISQQLCSCWINVRSFSPQSSQLQVFTSLFNSQY